VHLVFDIFQGIGVAAAVGIRPFLPALAVGALADADVQIDFKHTEFDFLQSPGFLLAMALGAILLALAERRFGAARFETRPFALALGLVAVALGALLFAGSLCRGHYVIWPGLIGGVVCALVGIAATRPLFTRARARLDHAAAAALPLYAEAAGLAIAVLSIVAPPVGPLALALLLWLLFAGWRRDEQKYAGLRILR
jgi:Domain of unknown function (DUF4126)